MAAALAEAGLLATRTLVYFGELKDVAVAAAGALRSGGRLIFTVEEATENDATSTYCIKPHGRFNHRPQYVERVLVEADLKVDIARAALQRGIRCPCRRSGGDGKKTNAFPRMHMLTIRLSASHDADGLLGEPFTPACSRGRSPSRGD
ncbi:MAG TPA: hypothetical protein VKV41_10790 [Methylomirabilota bacterium]|nr:hypothetical protein [Methylomirabilota bacterium]